VVTVPIQAVMLRPVKELADAAAGGGEKKDDAKPDEQEQRGQEGRGQEGRHEGRRDERVRLRRRRWQAKLRAVKSGISDETSVAILEGLKTRDRRDRAVSRLRDLKDGDAVKEKKAEPSKGRATSEGRGDHRLSALIDIRDVTKTYEMGAETIVTALDGVSLSDRGGGLRRDHGPLRVGQVHVDETSSAASTRRRRDRTC